MKRFLATLVLCACTLAGAQYMPTAAAPPSTANPAPPGPSGALNVYIAYGQSWAAGNQSSGRNVCLGSVQTPAGVGQVNTLVPFATTNYMMANWGAPELGANQSFQSSQVTSLLSFYDCGPSANPLSKRANGQSLGTSVSWLKTLDAGAGRGTVNRGYLEAGVGGRSITTLSKPTDGETCTASGTGPQCYCYANPSPGVGGTNGAQCVFPFTQAFVGATSMVGAMSARAVAGGQTAVVKAITWHQGYADVNTSQSAYLALLTQLITDTTAAVKATTGQAGAPDYILEQVAAESDGSSTNGPAFAQLQYLQAHLGQGVHTIGPQYYRHAMGSTTLTVGGTISNGDVGTVTFTSSAITGSPVALRIPIETVDTTTTVAAKIAAAVSGNAALTTAGIYATPVGAVVTLTQPGSTQPPFTLGVTNGSAVAFTFAYAQQEAHEDNVDKVWKGEAIGACEDRILKSQECPFLTATASVNVGSRTITLDYSAATGYSGPLVDDSTTVPAVGDGFKGYQLGVGMSRTSQTTAAGTTSLRFGATLPSAYAVPGQFVFDLDNPSAIPAGTTVVSLDTTLNRVNLSQQTAGGGVPLNDRILFSTCQRSITGVVVNTNSVTVTLNGDPTGCTLSYALWGLGQPQTSGPVDSLGNHQLTGFFGAYGNIRDSSGTLGTFSGRTLRNFAMNQQWAF